MNAQELIEQLKEFSQDATEIWITRDSDDTLCMWENCPREHFVARDGHWTSLSYMYTAGIINDFLPSVTFDNSPQKFVMVPLEQMHQQADMEVTLKKVALALLKHPRRDSIIANMDSYDTSISLHDNCIKFLKEMARDQRLEELDNVLNK
jgi:hypothetical protein